MSYDEWTIWFIQSFYCIFSYTGRWEQHLYKSPHETETFSALVALFEGNPRVAEGLPSTRASNVAQWGRFDATVNKLLNKQ